MSSEYLFSIRNQFVSKDTYALVWELELIHFRQYHRYLNRDKDFFFKIEIYKNQDTNI